MALFSRNQLKQALDCLKKGEIIALGTDTVPGLAVDSKHPGAIEKLSLLKRRFTKKKSYVLMTSAIERLCEEIVIPPLAKPLIKAYWPGPLTIIFPGKVKKSIGVRIPNDLFLQAILREYPYPLYVTSANCAGRKEGRSKKEVDQIFKNKIVNFIPKQTYYQAKSSTIVCVQQSITILRQGDLVIKKN